jgi:hypothetical protein
LAEPSTVPIPLTLDDDSDRITWISCGSGNWLDFAGNASDESRRHDRRTRGEPIRLSVSHRSDRHRFLELHESSTPNLPISSNFFVTQRCSTVTNEAPARES